MPTVTVDARRIAHTLGAALAGPLVGAHTDAVGAVAMFTKRITLNDFTEFTLEAFRTDTDLFGTELVLAFTGGIMLTLLVTVFMTALVAVVRIVADTLGLLVDRLCKNVIIINGDDKLTFAMVIAIVEMGARLRETVSAGPTFVALASFGVSGDEGERIGNTITFTMTSDFSTVIRARPELTEVTGPGLFADASVVQAEAVLITIDIGGTDGVCAIRAGVRLITHADGLVADDITVAVAGTVVLTHNGVVLATVFALPTIIAHTASIKIVVEILVIWVVTPAVLVAVAGAVLGFADVAIKLECTFADTTDTFAVGFVATIRASRKLTEFARPGVVTCAIQ